ALLKNGKFLFDESVWQEAAVLGEFADISDRLADPNVRVMRPIVKGYGRSFLRDHFDREKGKWLKPEKHFVIPMVIQPWVDGASWRQYQSETWFDELGSGYAYRCDLVNEEFPAWLSRAGYLFASLYLGSGAEKKYPLVRVSAGHMLIDRDKSLVLAGINAILRASKQEEIGEGEKDTGIARGEEPGDFLHEVFAVNGFVWSPEYKETDLDWVKKVPEDADKAEDSFRNRANLVLGGIWQALIKFSDGNKQAAQENLMNWIRQYNEKYPQDFWFLHFNETDLNEITENNGSNYSYPASSPLRGSNRAGKIPEQYLSAREGLVLLKQRILSKAQEIIDRKEIRPVVVVIDGRLGVGKTRIADALGHIVIGSGNPKKNHVFTNITSNNVNYILSSCSKPAIFEEKFFGAGMVVLEDWGSLSCVLLPIIDVVGIVAADKATRKAWLLKREVYRYRDFLGAGKGFEEMAVRAYPGAVFINNSYEYSLSLKELKVLFSGCAINPSSSPVNQPSEFSIDKEEIEELGIAFDLAQGLGAPERHLSQVARAIKRYGYESVESVASKIKVAQRHKGIAPYLNWGAIESLVVEYKKHGRIIFDFKKAIERFGEENVLTSEYSWRIEKPIRGVLIVTLSNLEYYKNSLALALYIEEELRFRKGRKDGHQHIIASFAYILFYEIFLPVAKREERCLLVVEIQSGVYGDLSHSYKRKLESYPQLLLLELEKFGKRENYSKILITPSTYQQSRWPGLPEEIAIRNYDKAAKELGYNPIDLIHPLRIGNWSIHTFHSKELADSSIRKQLPAYAGEKKQFAVSGLSSGAIAVPDSEVSSIPMGNERIKNRTVPNSSVSILDAIKGKEGGKVEIATSLDKSGQYVVVRIQDNGIGIQKDNLTKIFEPYFTNKPEGTGLGLAIVKRIIESYSGRIEVKSELSKGTTFIISLPVQESTSSPLAKPRRVAAGSPIEQKYEQPIQEALESIKEIEPEQYEFVVSRNIPIRFKKWFRNSRYLPCSLNSERHKIYLSKDARNWETDLVAMMIRHEFQHAYFFERGIFRFAFFRIQY
ncbi:MAG: ATP-binding protein, partial [Candidatus Omnitrophota bacterium]